MKSYSEVPLNLVRFQLAKGTQGKQLCVIEEWDNAEELEEKVGSGKQFIIPRAEIPSTPGQ